MPDTPISVSGEAARRLILGLQGLWPSRRFIGRADTERALDSACCVQVDPLNVVGRSHDIAMLGRVRGYESGHLEDALYRTRTAFEWGGILFVRPIGQLPFYRARMEVFGRSSEFAGFRRHNESSIRRVMGEIERNGPMQSLDFKGTRRSGGYWATKDTGRALYYLWLKGDLMIAGRDHGRRIYDLADRVLGNIPEAAGASETESNLAQEGIKHCGLASRVEALRSMRNASLRRISPEMVNRKLSKMVREGLVAQVQVEGWRAPAYVHSDYLGCLEQIAAGSIPSDWQSPDTDCPMECLFLAPLDIVSARGRASSLFGVRYLWEVYVPAEKRVWGYYTMPVLFGDRIVAKISMRTDRHSGTLLVDGFWPETEFRFEDSEFGEALGRAARRLASFNGVDKGDFSSVSSTRLRQHAAASFGSM